MNSRMIHFRVWSVFNYRKIEQWLAEKEKAGFKLKDVSFLGLRFKFVETAPHDASYRIEYATKNSPTVQNLLVSNHWEAICRVRQYTIYKSMDNDDPSDFAVDYSKLYHSAKKTLITAWASSVPVIIMPLVWMMISSPVEGFGPFGITLLVLVILILTTIIFSTFCLVGRLVLLHEKQK